MSRVAKGRVGAQRAGRSSHSCHVSLTVLMRPQCGSQEAQQDTRRKSARAHRLEIWLRVAHRLRASVSNDDQILCAYLHRACGEIRDGHHVEFGKRLQTER